MNTGPIGVFDSGIGGLSILRALRRALPHEDFHYIADAAHAPYGERGDPFVAQRAHALTQALVAQHHAKLVVVACNTATAAAVHSLRQAFPQIPIVGVEPALKPALARTAHRRIGVMATRTTLASAKFQALLQGLQGQASFVLRACDGLAEAIEHDDPQRITRLAREHLQALGLAGAASGPDTAPDTVVLGCTHYPLALDTLQALAGPGVGFVEPGEAVARRVQGLLRERGIARAGVGAAGVAEADPPAGSARSGGSPPAEGRVVLSAVGDDAALVRAAARQLGQLGSDPN